MVFTIILQLLVAKRVLIRQKAYSRLSTKVQQSFDQLKAFIWYQVGGLI